MLNPEQQQAVKATEGRVLIIAGAGSGKTSVLSHRIAHLIALGIPPKGILGLTFTNKAAQEMRERVAGLIGKERAKEVTLSTFHSFCYRLLRKEIHHLGYTSDFSLYDEQDVKRLLKQLTRDFLEHEGELPSIEGIYAKISQAKSRGEDSISDQTGKELFERLQVSMRAYNAVDFDSLLSLTVQLFEKFPDVLARYQERYKYILIDEYQDTNSTQHQIVEKLSAKHGNLCVVGDDDQSIYAWRGAEVKNILNFQPTTTIKLEQNYRSTPLILKAAHAVISKNGMRLGKELWSSQKEGEKIALFHAPSEVEEATAVVDRVIRLHQERGIPWKEIAILYRSNILVRPFEEALMKGVWQKGGEWRRGIPYRIFGGTPFYERSEIKDLLAYLKCIMNPLDAESMLRILNVPRRGISDQTLDHLTQKNRKENISLWEVLQKAHGEELSSKAVKGIASFTKIIEAAREKFAERPLSSALKWLIEETNYKKAIEEEVKSEKMRAFKWENVHQCVDVLEAYEQQMEQEGTPEEISLAHFLTTTLLDKESWQKEEKETKEDRINLMTFHSAKGLEFEACFLVCLEDHLLPHEKSFSTAGIEEERRLFYVAMTRAKKHLTLSMARQRKRMGKEANSNPSRFLFDIPQALLEVTSHKT